MIQNFINSMFMTLEAEALKTLRLIVFERRG